MSKWLKVLLAIVAGVILFWALFMTRNRLVDFWKSLDVFLKPLTEIVAILGGGFTLVQLNLARKTYAENVTAHIQSLSKQKSILTQEAIKYYMTDVKGSVQYTINRYTETYYDLDFDYKEVISESNLKTTIAKLDYLGTYMGAISEDLLKSAITDDVLKLLNLEDMDLALGTFKEISARENYLKIFTLVRGDNYVEKSAN